MNKSPSNVAGGNPAHRQGTLFEQLDAAVADAHTQLERVRRRGQHLQVAAAGALSREEAQERISKDARDGVLEQVAKHADGAWKIVARQVVDQLAMECAPFSTDEVWPILDPLPVSTHERRALGWIIRAAIKDGVIVDSGRMCNSVRRNATKITLWVGKVHSSCPNARYGAGHAPCRVGQ